MTSTVPQSDAPATRKVRHRILASLLSCRSELAKNGWVVRKRRGGSGAFVVRWRGVAPDGGTRVRTTYLGNSERLVKAVRRLLRRWRRRAGTVPSERLAVALSLTRKMANELDLHPRARRRLGELRRQARISGNDKLLFDVLADKSGRWTEFVLYGNSWTDRLRREGLVV